MMKNYEYFKRKRANDPTYAVDDAVKEWLAAHPDDAVELAELAWPNVDGSGRPMTNEDLERCLGYWSLMQFVHAGYASEYLNEADPYLELVGGYHFRSLSRAEYVDACMDYMLDEGYNAILDEDIRVPRELKQIIALWSDRSANLRPRSGTKTRAKSPARKQPSKSSNAKSKNAKSPNRKPSQARRR